MGLGYLEGLVDQSLLAALARLQALSGRFRRAGQDRRVCRDHPVRQVDLVGLVGRPRQERRVSLIRLVGLACLWGLVTLLILLGLWSLFLLTGLPGLEDRDLQERPVRQEGREGR
jgi:hypothetical protein